MTKFLPVPMVPDGIEFLYGLLGEREDHVNISHKKMPTFEEHEAFVKSEPYEAWYIMLDDDDFVGSVYLTDRREVGIFISKLHQGMRYGSEALAFMEKTHGLPIYANISVNNPGSVAFFRSKGFTPLQITLLKDRSDS